MKKVLALGLIGLASACSQSKSPTHALTEPGTQSSYSTSGTNFRLSLTDAPKKEFSKVFVNIAQIELFIRKSGQDRRLVIGQNTGSVDLLTLRNGVLLPIHDVQMPEGTEIRQIRLLLNPAGNYGVKTDGSQCSLQTPSAQQSGVKILLSQPVVIASGYTYSMVVDFDAGKSVVQKGNGGCLLKPVIKMNEVRRKPIETDEDNSSGGDSSGGGTGTGGDTGGNTGGDSGGGTGSGTGGDSGENSGGEEVINPGGDSNVPPTDGTGDSGTGSDTGSGGTTDPSTGYESDYDPTKDPLVIYPPELPTLP